MKMPGRKNENTLSNMADPVFRFDMMSFDSAKKLAFGYSCSTYLDISKEIKLSLPEVVRMFNDTEYCLSVHEILRLCDALDNTILVEWIAAQVGCRLVKVKPSVCSDGEQFYPEEMAGLSAMRAVRVAESKMSKDELIEFIKEMSGMAHMVSRILKMSQKQLREIDAEDVQSDIRL